MNDYHELIAERVTEQAAKLGRFVDYIEVGVLTGNSAKAVLSTGKVRYAVLIDNFSNTHCGESVSSPEIARANLSAYEGLFDIRVGDSRDILPTIVEEFDIGFVDGDHTNEAAWSDMSNMLKILREDGIMFVDDLDNIGYTLKILVERFAFEHQLSFTHHSVHEGLGELRR